MSFSPREWHENGKVIACLLVPVDGTLLFNNKIIAHIAHSRRCSHTEEDKDEDNMRRRSHCLPDILRLGRRKGISPISLFTDSGARRSTTWQSFLYSFPETEHRYPEGAPELISQHRLCSIWLWPNREEDFLGIKEYAECCIGINPCVIRNSQIIPRHREGGDDPCAYVTILRVGRKNCGPVQGRTSSGRNHVGDKWKNIQPSPCRRSRCCWWWTFEEGVEPHPDIPGNLSTSIIHAMRVFRTRAAAATAASHHRIGWTEIWTGYKSYGGICWATAHGVSGRTKNVLSFTCAAQRWRTGPPSTPVCGSAAR